MAFDRQSALKKIAALLTTAERGSTEGERLTAMAMAQRLMQKHRIEQYEVAKAGGYTMPSIKGESAGTYKQGSLWVVDVMTAIAAPMGVDVLNNRFVGGTRAQLFGRPESIAYVRLLTDWIVPQLGIACAAALIVEKGGRRNAGLPWSWGDTIRYKRSFFYGATDRLRDRLREDFEEGEVGTEIVLSDRAAIDEHYDLMNMKVSSYSVTRASVDTSGAQAGASAANRVDIDPSNKVATAPQGQLR